MATFEGGDGPDNYVGGNKADLIRGNGGGDFLDGGRGADTVEGGAGMDNVLGGLDLDRDLLDGGDGDDFVSGRFHDTLAGGLDNDQFTLRFNNVAKGLKLDMTGAATGGTWIGAGHTQLSGFERGRLFMGAGDDVVNAGDHELTISGGDGDDRLIGGGTGINQFDGGAGNDTMYGGAGLHDRAMYTAAKDGVEVHLNNDGPQNTRGAGIDLLNGIEEVWGSRHNDTFGGSLAADALYGFDGRDAFVGGGQGDTMLGGAGKDRFAFVAVLDGDDATETTDAVVADRDIVGLSDIDADVTQPGDQAFTIIETAFTGHAGEMRVYFDGNSTRVYIDVDGDGFTDGGIWLGEGDQTGLNFAL